MNAQVVLKRIVEMAGGAAERGYVLAIAGEGLEELPATLDTVAGRYAVVRPSSEIALRHTLWKSGGAPVLALLSPALAKRLPADLVRRARGRKIHAVEPAELLSLALGVQVIGTDDPDLQRLAIEHVDRIRDLIGQRTLPTVVDRELLDELLVDVILVGKLRHERPGALLAGWLLEPPAWTPPVRDLVARQLERLGGIEGKILAWAVADPARLEPCLVHGALLALDEPELPQSTWGKLWGVFRELGLLPETFRRGAATLAREALDALGDRAAEYLKRAESVARRTLQQAVLARSRDLPLGLDNLCASVAQRAADGEAVAHAEIEAMTRHRFAGARGGEIAVLEEMVRLSRWLAEPERDHGGDVVAHVRQYQQQGAFADWAAARLRVALAGSLSHQKQAEAVLARYRARRDRENEAFAAALRADYVKALHADGLVPLHRIWTKPPLRREGGEGVAERLYLVVLDGCSYPVFLRLLAELAGEVAPIGLRFDPQRERLAIVPALAPLPTITSHARSAIFLGEIPKDPWIAETVWRDTREAATDPARFKQNAALGARSRRLFLKGDLADHGQALLGALRDGATGVVAAVFNAVDDQIGGANTGAAVTVRAREITALVPSLRAALEAGRRVVITADHGHSPYWGKQLRVGDGSSPRHRLLGAGDPVPAGFVEIDDGGLGGEPGRKAFAWKMGAYLGMPQVGFHGGCSLEEMVVPLCELVSGGVAADEPTWWYSGVQATGTKVEPEPATPAPALTPRPAPAPGPKPAPAPAPPAPVQGHLFPPEREIMHASLIERLGLPAALRAELERSEQAALAVVFESKSARSSDIAARLARPLNRVPGLMSRLMGKLHAGGFPCLRRQPLPDGEEQYVYVPQGTERA
ncbi:hypothetical protein BE21_43865 [Sorangium cellulosum]|uniref:Uncharacterized protein n=1 Tax=Sorangium cellulosum TaxID=56 RepID=A0A150TJU5_SORCE|nr:hypothetical protein BE21_43865 [Sorangium cellulosum]